MPVRIEFISRTRSDVKVADTFKISSERIQCVKRMHGSAASQLFSHW